MNFYFTNEKNYENILTQEHSITSFKIDVQNIFYINQKIDKLATAKGAHEQASITLKLFYVIAISFFISNCQAMKLPFIGN